jgi:hypothetical protein
MKNIGFLIIFFWGTFCGFAQKDTPFKAPKLKLNWDIPQTKTPETPAAGIPFKSILDKNDFYLKRYSILKKETETASVLEKKSEFKNPGDEWKKKINKEINEGSKTDVFFGKFVVTTPTIIIKTRDYMDPDGDKVRIIINGEIIYLVVELESYFKTHIVTLKEGENLLDILALNQGLSGPNTATFAIYDGNENLITTNDWNLNTGLAAKFLLDYKKPLPKK